MLGAKRPIEHASNPLWVAPGGAQRARKADALLAAALQDQQAWAPWPLRELTVAQHLQQAEGRDLDRLGRVRLGQVAAGLGHALVLLHHRHDLLHGRLPRVGTAGSGFWEEVRFSGEPAGSLQSARRGGETALGAGLALRASAGAVFAAIVVGRVGGEIPLSSLELAPHRTKTGCKLTPHSPIHDTTPP